VSKAQSIALRHLDVTDDQIQTTTKVLDNLKGVNTVFGFQRLKALPLQNGADVLPNGHFVIHNKRDRHTSCRWSLPSLGCEKSRYRMIILERWAVFENSSKEPP